MTKIKTEDEVVEEPEPGKNREEILVSSKQSGFQRDGPQFQPGSKQTKPTFESETCEETFSSTRLSKSISETMEMKVTGAAMIVHIKPM